MLHLSGDPILCISLSLSLSLFCAGLSVSDGFVGTPLMGGRVAGTGAVTNGMSMVREGQAGGRRKEHDTSNQHMWNTRAQSAHAPTFLSISRTQMTSQPPLIRCVRQHPSAPPVFFLFPRKNPAVASLPRVSFRVCSSGGGG